MRTFFPKFLLLLVLLLVAGGAYAQKSTPSFAMPGVSLNVGGQSAVGSGKEVSNSLQILALLTVLSMAPAILLLTTAFTRIVIIFSFVRSALGTPSIPPNQVMIGLSLFLTAYVMQPTYEKVSEAALKPMSIGKMTPSEAIEAATPPIRDFMLKSTYQTDLRMLLDLRKEKPATKEQLSLFTLIPAFIISELKTAFIIGFYIFIPFLIIDLIVASSLMSMGMMMLPPVVISLPAKILVFVLADGWSNLVGAILTGYR